MYNPQLKTFISVADSGSFSKAAENLFITPTAVIKQINLLENTLEIQLFTRTHRGVLLTEAGKSLYQDAKYIIQYSKDSLIRAKNAIKNDEKYIRIGVSLITPSQFLVDMLPQIKPLLPHTKFELISFENTPENAREILHNLGKNIDVVAGIFDSAFLQNSHCEGLEFTKMPICCAVSIHHKLANKKILTFQDLCGENFMLIQKGWNKYIDKLREDIENFYPQINIVDFPFYDVNIFNKCVNSNYCLCYSYLLLYHVRSNENFY